MGARRHSEGFKRGPDTSRPFLYSVSVPPLELGGFWRRSDWRLRLPGKAVVLEMSGHMRHRCWPWRRQQSGVVGYGRPRPGGLPRLLAQRRVSLSRVGGFSLSRGSHSNNDLWLFTRASCVDAELSLPFSRNLTNWVGFYKRRGRTNTARS